MAEAAKAAASEAVAEAARDIKVAAAASDRSGRAIRGRNLIKGGSNHVEGKRGVRTDVDSIGGGGGAGTRDKRSGT